MKARQKRIIKAVFNWLLAVMVVAGVWYAMAPPAPKHKAPKNLVQVPVVKPHEYYPPAAGEESGAPAPETPLPVLPPPAPEAGQKPMIAIVIDDVGLDFRGSERAAALPAAVTLSFLPYANHLKEQTREASGSGHELLLHMPMEPMGHDNPGPGALLVV